MERKIRYFWTNLKKMNMKKLLLSAAVICAASTLNAQILSASGLAEFATWSVADIDGDGKTWGVYDLLAGGGSGTSFDSQGEVLGSFSYDNPTATALTPDNWVISPEFSLNLITNSSLTFKVAAPDDTYYAEHYAVYVATTPAGLATATPVLEETIATADNLDTKVIDISAFDGETAVYVAIRHYDVTDEFAIFVDDIMVTGSLGIEENVVSSTVYPNPTSEVLNVKSSEGIVSIKVLSLDGKVVATANGSSVNVAELNAGVYMYEATTSTGKVSRDTFMKN